MGENGTRKWIDFEDLKRTANIEATLSALELLDGLVHIGNEWKGHCPFHKGEGNAKPFCFNEEKKAFHCFVCKRKGNVLDFVKMYLEWKDKGTVGVRSAAEFIASAMEKYTPKAREEFGEGTPIQAVLEQETEVPKKDAKQRKSKKPAPPGLNRENFVGFIEACRMVSLGQATAHEFVAVRVSFLQELRSMLFSDEVGEE